MKKWTKFLTLSFLAFLVLGGIAHASVYKLTVMRTDATDCTSIIDGKDSHVCYEQDSKNLYVCNPDETSYGTCDTPSEWRSLTEKEAEDIGVSTTNFGNNLSGTDTNVQTALDTLDDLTIMGAADIDTFSELDAIVADKSLLNKEDASTIAGEWTFSASILNINQDIVHDGDSDTWIRFETDRIRMFTGNVDMINLQETSQNNITFNEGGADVDFRVESDNEVNALYVEGSSGNVGIGISSPASILNIYKNSPSADQTLFKIGTSDDDSRFTVDEDGDVNADGSMTIGGANERITAKTSGEYIDFSTDEIITLFDEDGTAYFSADSNSIDINQDIIHIGDSDTWIRFETDRIRMFTGNVDMINLQETSQNNITFNEGGADVDFRVESDNEVNALYVEGSSGNVGIGTSAPRSLVDIDKGTGIGQITLDGSSGGCLMLRDTDDDGWTECDVLDGTITCSIDADGICD